MKIKKKYNKDNKVITILESGTTITEVIPEAGPKPRINKYWKEKTIKEIDDITNFEKLRHFLKKERGLIK